MEVLQCRNGLQGHLPGWMHVTKYWSVFSQEIHMLPFLFPFASVRLGLGICKTLSDDISTTLLFNIANAKPGTLTPEMAMRPVLEPTKFCCREHPETSCPVLQHCRDNLHCLFVLFAPALPLPSKKEEGG